MIPSIAEQTRQSLAVIGAHENVLRAERDLLIAAIRLVLPEIRYSLKAGDGRFTSEQVRALEDALLTVEGGQ